MKSISRILAIGIPSIIVLAAILQTKVDPRLLMLDPMVAADVSGDCCHTYYGIISTLGVMGWIAGATVCGFAAILFWHMASRRNLAIYAAFAFAMTLTLGFDDAFLFHENIAPKLGIPQTAVLVAYLGLAVIYLALGWRYIFQNDWLLFGAAGGFLALSMGLDVVLHSTHSMVVSAEDGAKFIGICCWLAFHVTAFSKLALQDAGDDTVRVSTDELRNNGRLANALRGPSPARAWS